MKQVRRIELGRAEPGPLTRAMLDTPPDSVEEVLRRATEFGALATSDASDLIDSWEALASVAAVDLEVARALEPHLDAVSIVRQAAETGSTVAEPSGAWGVFAAEGGSDPLVATETATGWRLTGTKPWCSLASRLDGALVTAHIRDQRGLFAINLHDDGVRVREGEWHARGLTEITSSAIRLEDVAGEAVGAPGWYLERPGFDIGGIGVAACWFGGAVGIARSVFDGARARADTLTDMHLGAADLAIEASRLALVNAAALAANGLSAAQAKPLAKRVRGIVARTVETVLRHSAHALGPAPLAQDDAHAKRIADLELYVRQHHAERDDESLGRLLRSSERSPW